MKTVASVSILLGATLVCLAAAGYRPALIAMERHQRHAERLAAEKNALPLVLDATTKSILVGADRVETFRLVDPNEDQDESQSAVVSKPRTQYLDHHQVLRVGPPQSKAFAAALATALSEVPSPRGSDGQLSIMPGDFGPDIGFRIWNGKAHADICVGIHCGMVEIISKDAKHKAVFQEQAASGKSRAAFLALSRQAFPQDAALAAVKDTEGD